MKRIIAIVLLAALLIPVLCGCKKDDAAGENNADYRVGFAREDVMPKTPVTLGGYGNPYRVNKGYLDMLYAHATAITDKEDNTLIIIAIDTLNFPEDMVNKCRPLISEKTGVPQVNVLFNASHSHSTPTFTLMAGGVGITEYRALVEEKVIAAAEAAMASRVPAKMQWTKFDIDGLNFVKHVKFTDGTYGGDNFGDFTGKTIEGYATSADHEMRVMKFVREGADDVILYNWQGHPLITGGINKTDMSADYVGSTRDAFEAQNPGTKLVFFQGCAGDMNTRSHIAEDQPTTDNKLFGQNLSAQIMMGLASLKDVPAGTVKATEFEYVGKVNHSEDYLASVAQPIASYFNQTGDREGGNEMCKAYGLNSVYHAAFIVKKAAMGETDSMMIYAYQIGPIGLAATPTEMFNDLGEYIRENSPYDYTMTLGYSNGAHGYLPTELAYTYNSYEVSNCTLEAGTSEKIAEKLVEMLKEIKSE